MSVPKLLRTELLGLSPSIFGKTFKLPTDTRDKLLSSLERLDDLEKSHREALERLRLKPTLPPGFPPGHYYSPLLDLDSLAPSSLSMPFDGVECWEHIDLRPQEQRIYYEDL